METEKMNMERVSITSVPSPPSDHQFYELLYNDPFLSSFRICSASVEDNSGIEVAEDINGKSEDFQSRKKIHFRSFN